ncbi:MAG: hypothetical protein A2934_05450 [Candidatus Sungbacteria bacterium RIFCSPLOWO2_01_FULL_47_10]|uniref:DUF2178 domain-containing protein n=1 Tax=Candidatus Sungbacteria bacterium RIFCSPLOWO2_01_FULL_47_10 TaxID=1802276 RepID=A0A1G2L456_9BACT|nr:MAG: hypothetical protein A2934_05450 [Candidatus Sungbacteria bacterium RIFCSPLOWO2_01_FULL_47_10]
MKDYFFQELGISGVLLILLALLLDPFHVWMPDEFSMFVVLVLIMLFMFFASFVWRERGKDEREAFHIQTAGRMAFLAGACFLLIGIVYQSFQHTVDPWLVLALSIMILAKAGGFIYGRVKL